MQEGANPLEVNTLTRDFGFPVGVFQMSDEVGCDVGSTILLNLNKSIGPRFHGGDMGIYHDMIKLGFYGRKCGKGLFLYDESKGSTQRTVNQVALDMVQGKFKLPTKGADSDEDRLIRMVSRFVNESVLCLEEEILFSPLEGDIGAVFGVGFPPFSGGPFRWVDHYGAGILVEKMLWYADLYGAPFVPAQTLVDMAKDSSKKFYPN